MISELRWDNGVIRYSREGTDNESEEFYIEILEAF